ncbi:two-component system, chemotaxis family, response regulator CheY [Desulfocicer vacuolatum DSM 3385]|uniref:Two-component system, chemotaxis family, response regulator CheY n=1 Tax=Desulfocicer vacuolatum DSM 3385 TaxID=1121400 RepID=A0A1W2BEB8_9BACT|nr:response regulator [Desulfocicer vacuolatum]SMC71236.1 two-component system, chemotaxis family, response regulator CheY [Desulfocicer vacuolatum DSM 3385]
MKKILIVDDSAFTRAIHKNILTAHDFSVIEAGGGGEALEILKSDSPHAVVLDLLMEDMDGMDVARKMLALDPDLVVVICSTDKQKYRQADAVDIGCRAFLPKPLNPEQLVETLNQHLTEPT